METETTLLTLDDIAQRFQVSRRTVTRWVDAGCPVLRPPVGTVQRFDFEQVLNWVRGNDPVEN